MFKLNYTTNRLNDLTSKPYLTGSFRDLLAADSIAVQHWVFDKSNDDGLVDLVSQSNAIANGTESYKYNAISINAEYQNGIDTGIAQSAKTLIWGLVRKPYNSPYNAYFAGNGNSNSAGDGFFVNNIDANNLVLRSRNEDGTTGLIGHPNYANLKSGEWFFFSAYVGDINDNASLAISINDDYRLLTLSESRVIDVSDRNISIANRFYPAHSFSDSTLEFAEFGISNVEMTEQISLDLYNRAKIRMINRGINLK